jgi:hypothetical protein
VLLLLLRYHALGLIKNLFRVLLANSSVNRALVPKPRADTTRHEWPHYAQSGFSFSWHSQYRWIALTTPSGGMSICSNILPSH